MSRKRLGELKFIAGMMAKAMEEFDTIMGVETIQTIFRLIGENQGDAIVKRLSERYSITDWTPEQFAEKIVSDVLNPALGEGNGVINVNGKEITIQLKVCPFKRAGMKISNKFYCTYTEGMFDLASKGMLRGCEFSSEKLRAVDNCDCQFKITIP